MVAPRYLPGALFHFKDSKYKPKMRTFTHEFTPNLREKTGVFQVSPFLAALTNYKFLIFTACPKKSKRSSRNTRLFSKKIQTFSASSKHSSAKAPKSRCTMATFPSFSRTTEHTKSSVSAAKATRTASMNLSITIPK